MHMGSFLVEGSNPLCPFSWGFLKDYLGMDSVWVIVYFLVSRLESLVRHSASVLKMLGATPYSAQEGEAWLLSQLLNHSLEIMEIPREDQSLLLLQCL
jgi:hypothetical protein